MSINSFFPRNDISAIVDFCISLQYETETNRK